MDQRRFGGRHWWRIEQSCWGNKTLNTIAGKMSCLSATFVSQPDAKLFQLIKTSSGLGFSRRCAKKNARQVTKQVAKNSLLLLLHLAHSSTKLQAILKHIKQVKDKGVTFATLLSAVLYETKYGPSKYCKNIEQRCSRHSFKNMRGRAFDSLPATTPNIVSPSTF